MGSLHWGAEMPEGDVDRMLDDGGDSLLSIIQCCAEGNLDDSVPVEPFAPTRGF